MTHSKALAFAFLAVFVTAPYGLAQSSVPSRPGAGPDAIPLWPGAAPGDKGEMGPERDTTKPDPSVPPEKYIIRLGDVAKPSITVFKAPADKNTGAAVVVCPGGGYSILAWDLEGTEVCKWLNDLGVTGVLL